MNIFAVNDDPRLAARDLPDKLVCKMPTESAQLLTPWAFNTHKAYIWKPDGSHCGLKGFANHSCMRWLYEDPANVVWLHLHAQELTEEYTRRYGKQHGISYALAQLDELIRWHYPDTNWVDHTPFPQAMPDEFKVEGDSVTAYRNYLNGFKGYAVWRYSEKPSWWDEAKHEPVRNKYLAEREAKRIKRQNDKHHRIQASLQN